MLIVEALTILIKQISPFPRWLINDETFYCSPVTPSEPAALCPLVPFLCKSGQTFACFEISGAAERVHQLLLTIQVVNSKPTQLTQNEKYSTLDAVRENHLYYFLLNVPSIQMQKYFTFCSRNPPQICSCNSNPLNDVFRESSTSSLIYLLPIISDKT